jgi:hypothetical protein
MHYTNQRAALEAAAQIVEVLPPGTIFSVAVTNDDKDAVLNIYTRSWAEKPRITRLLNIEDLEPSDTGENFTMYEIGPLMVSIIEEEAHE